jgi:hypothetical protein
MSKKILMAKRGHHAGGAAAKPDCAAGAAR